MKQREMVETLGILTVRMWRFLAWHPLIPLIHMIWGYHPFNSWQALGVT